MTNKKITEEITKKAAEKACSAYSKVLKDKITLENVKTSISSFKDFLKQFEASATPAVIVVYFLVYRTNADGKQNIAGIAVAIFESNANAEMDEKSRNFISETANILIGTYLGTISNEADDNLRASIQPVFKSTANEAANILENQLFHGNKEEEMSLTEVALQDGSSATLYVFLK